MSWAELGNNNIKNISSITNQILTQDRFLGSTTTATLTTLTTKTKTISAITNTILTNFKGRFLVSEVNNNHKMNNNNMNNHRRFYLEAWSGAPPLEGGNNIKEEKNYGLWSKQR